MASLPLALLAVAIGATFVVEWTTVLSIAGGLLLVGLGAMWPGLWLAAAIGRLRERSRAGGPASVAHVASEQPAVRFSVLVPARNEAAVVERMVTQLLTQTYGEFEALILTNNCTDDTAEIARRAAAGDPRVKVLEATFQRGVKADALNFALPQVSGNVIVQLDTDNVVDPDFLEQLAETFRDPTTNAVQTAIRACNTDDGLLPVLQDIEFLVYSDVFNAGRSALGLSSSIGGTGFAIRTAIMRRLGGWSRHLVEDFELHLRLARAGIKVGYLGSLTVYDEKPATWSALINQRRRWIRGHVSLALSPGSAKGLPFAEAVYLYSPLGIALSLALLCLGYATVAAPGIIPAYAYLSPAFWLVSLAATFAMLITVTRRGKNRAGLDALLAYVFLFGFHWVVVLLAAMLPASWAKTKTVHGRESRRSLAGFFGVDGWRSMAVMGATLALAGIWLTPLFSAVASPDALAAALHPIQAPASSTVAVLSVVQNADAAGRVSLRGSVTAASDGSPIKGAKLALSRGGKVKYSGKSAANGSFLISVTKPGTYGFSATKAGYVKGSTALDLGSGETVSVTVLLSKVHGGIIYVVPVPY